MSKLHIIFKGKHRSNTHRLWGLKFKPLFGKSYMEGHLKLDKTCRYYVPHNDTPINKLVGFSFGLNHQKNSIRLGWRCESHGFFVPVLYLYSYVDGERIIKRLGMIEFGKTYLYQLYVFNGFHEAEIYNLNGTESLYDEAIACEGYPSRFNYKLFPYFGGKGTAPHKMYMWV